jgi:hypothetical protein
MDRNGVWCDQGLASSGLWLARARSTVRPGGVFVNEERLKRLDLLASKLGTTVDKLWSIMLQQARIEAYTDLFLASVFIGFIIFFLRFVFKHGKDILDEKELYLPFAIIGTILSFVLLIAAIVEVSSLPTEFLNPGYFALERIMSKVK